MTNALTAEVYGIPNCDSVKKAVASLKSNGFEVVFHDFKKHGVSDAQLEEWIAAFGLDKVINRKGTTWRALDEASQNKAQSVEGAKALITEFPSLIKRPVVKLRGELVNLTIGQTNFIKGQE